MNSPIATFGKSQAVVIPANCEGIPARGVEAEFFQHYPNAMRPYLDACRGGDLQPGKCLLNWIGEEHPRWSIHLPVRQALHHAAKKDFILQGLDDAARIVDENAIESIAFASFSCNRGRISWREIQSMIAKTFSRFGSGYLQLEIIDFVPQNKPAGERLQCR